MYGLSEEVIKEINEVFVKNDFIKEVVLYGSRAKETYTNGSDIDFAIKGDNITLQQIFDIENQLEDLDFLYKFDVHNYASIANSDLLHYINTTGKIFYSR